MLSRLSCDEQEMRRKADKVRSRSDKIFSRWISPFLLCITDNYFSIIKYGKFVITESFKNVCLNGKCLHRIYDIMLVEVTRFKITKSLTLGVKIDSTQLKFNLV